MFRVRLIQTILPVALVTTNHIFTSRCDDNELEIPIASRQLVNESNYDSLEKSRNESKNDVKVLDSFLSTIDRAQQKFLQKVNQSDNTSAVVDLNQELEDTVKMLEIKLKRMIKVQFEERIDLSELISRVERDLKKGTDLLAEILEAQGKHSNESKDVYERALAKALKHYGKEGANTGQAYANLGNFYYELAAVKQTADSRRELLLLSKSYYNEAEKILIKIFGPDHPRTTEVSSILSIISHKL